MSSDKKMGRPRITFDLEEVEKVAKWQCTYEEMAAWFNCSVDTIRDRVRTDPEFSEALKKGREAGKLSLRREQFNKAIGGNTTMQIWLGKQMLDQRDRPDIVTRHEMQEFSDAYIEAGRNLVEGIASGAPREKVLEIFVQEVQAIAGNTSPSEDGQPN